MTEVETERATLMEEGFQVTGNYMWDVGGTDAYTLTESAGFVSGQLTTMQSGQDGSTPTWRGNHPKETYELVKLGAATLQQTTSDAVAPPEHNFGTNDYTLFVAANNSEG